MGRRAVGVYRGNPAGRRSRLAAHLIGRKELEGKRRPQKTRPPGAGEVVRILIREPDRVDEERVVSPQNLGACFFGERRVSEVKGSVRRVPIPPVEEQLRMPLKKAEYSFLGCVLEEPSISKQSRGLSSRHGVNAP